MLVLENGKCPVEDWITKDIKDVVTRAKIIRQFDKLQRGIFGDWKSVGDQILELRLDFGPGYRIYYARVGVAMVVIILGGDKGSQSIDIKRSQQLWNSFVEEGIPANRLKIWGDTVHET